MKCRWNENRKLLYGSFSFILPIFPLCERKGNRKKIIIKYKSYHFSCNQMQNWSLLLILCVVLYVKCQVCTLWKKLSIKNTLFISNSKLLWWIQLYLFEVKNNVVRGRISLKYELNPPYLIWVNFFFVYQKSSKLAFKTLF